MKIRIIETLERVVEADSLAEVQDLYENVGIVLNADDFTGVTFEEVEERKEGKDEN